MSGQVVVLGSLNADLTVGVARLPRAGETVAGSALVVAPGGKSANQAVAAARCGASVRLVGTVGDDEHGRFLLSRTGGAGVDVSGVAVLAGHATGTAVIVVDEAGENTIVVSPGANGQRSDVDGLAPGAGDVVCLCLEVPVTTVLAAARAAREAGARVLLNPSPWTTVPEELLGLADVLLLNAGEAAELAGPSWRDTLRDRLRGLGVPAALVTLGADGALLLDGDAEHAVAAERVEVVDTTGCGDAVLGALAHRLVRDDGLLDAARFACRAGSLAATAAGAQSSYDRLAELAD